MLKRIFDIIVSLVGLIIMSPVLISFSFLIWLQDRHNPLYLAPRVGKSNKTFMMIKLRSMVINADQSGVDSTTSVDKRITSIGHIIRKIKLDEFSQLINVLLGQMSLVGPRPQVQRDVNLYTNNERKLLDVVPGITDFASIVFSDEGHILEDETDPDLAYNQLIRPWKSRLSLFYINNRTFLIDLKLIIITAIAIISKKRALLAVHSVLSALNAPENLLSISRRKNLLVPTPPPGTDNIVRSRG